MWSAAGEPRDGRGRPGAELFESGGDDEDVQAGQRSGRTGAAVVEARAGDLFLALLSVLGRMVLVVTGRRLGVARRSGEQVVLGALRRAEQPLRASEHEQGRCQDGGYSQQAPQPHSGNLGSHVTTRNL